MLREVADEVGWRASEQSMVLYCGLFSSCGAFVTLLHPVLRHSNSLHAFECGHCFLQACEYGPHGSEGFGVRRPRIWILLGISVICTSHASQHNSIRRARRLQESGLIAKNNTAFGTDKPATFQQHRSCEYSTSPRMTIGLHPRDGYVAVLDTETTAWVTSEAVPIDL